MERNTKLVLAWHLGDRDFPSTEAFTEKLHYATSGHFQLTTGWLLALSSRGVLLTRNTR